MNARERFHTIMSFQQPDRIPMWKLEAITEQAVRRWCSEGLPLGAQIDRHVGFDPVIAVPLSTDPLPNFVPRTIATDENSFTTIDRYGFTVRTMKHAAVSPTTYYYLKGCVDTRADWEAMKNRYDPTDIRRYGTAWGDDLFEYYRTATCPIALTLTWGPGRGIKNGYMLGLEGFLDRVANEPALLEDMFEFWCDFLIRLVAPLLDRVQPDYIFLDEDGIAYKNSALVSPSVYRRLWIPHIRRFVEFVRSKGVAIVGHYTSGDVSCLIPALLDAGVTLFAPIEVASGMDVGRLRRTFGKNILLMGNIARDALIEGPEAIDRQLDAKVPVLLREGGYIPAVDDQILPDVSYSNYMYYVHRIRNYPMAR